MNMAVIFLTPRLLNFEEWMNKEKIITHINDEFFVLDCPEFKYLCI